MTYICLKTKRYDIFREETHCEIDFHFFFIFYVLMTICHLGFLNWSKKNLLMDVIL